MEKRYGLLHIRLGFLFNAHVASSYGHRWNANVSNENRTGKLIALGVPDVKRKLCLADCAR
jgi:hypothetical protein